MTYRENDAYLDFIYDISKLSSETQRIYKGWVNKLCLHCSKQHILDVTPSD